MKVQEHASLKQYNTFGVEARADLMLSIETEEDLLSCPPFNPARDLVLGGGSNILLVTDVPGTVFLNRITGHDIIEEHDGQVLIETGAGENWHQLVLWSLEQGLCGLENLSLIPGLAGAAPVQNIGAYGVELSSVLDCVTAWDMKKSSWTVFDHAECRLAYRDSRFKSAEAGRYVITSLRLRLNRRFTPHLAYAGLRDELRTMGIIEPNASQVSDAVIRIRREKLPDPSQEGNAGSFFKNPVVEVEQARMLQDRFSDLPGWQAGPGHRKLSAAWMIEYCGLKGISVGDAGVSHKHSLVLINRGAASGSEIAALANIIRTKVFEAFGIKLEQEPVQVQF